MEWGGVAAIVSAGGVAAVVSAGGFEIVTESERSASARERGGGAVVVMLLGRRSGRTSVPSFNTCANILCMYVCMYVCMYFYHIFMHMNYLHMHIYNINTIVIHTTPDQNVITLAFVFLWSFSRRGMKNKTRGTSSHALE